MAAAVDVVPLGHVTCRPGSGSHGSARAEASSLASRPRSTSCRILKQPQRRYLKRRAASNCDAFPPAARDLENGGVSASAIRRYSSHTQGAFSLSRTTMELTSLGGGGLWGRLLGEEPSERTRARYPRQRDTELPAHRHRQIAVPPCLPLSLLHPAGRKSFARRGNIEVGKRMVDRGTTRLRRYVVERLG